MSNDLKPSKTDVAQNEIENHIKRVSDESGLSLAVATKGRRSLVTDSGSSSYMEELEAAHTASNSQASEIMSNDMSSLISRLNGQMYLLEMSFAAWSARALEAKNIDQATKLMNTAMRIQSNMRMTAQTICDIKHPRQQVNFVQTEQANLATNQQINCTRE